MTAKQFLTQIGFTQSKFRYKLTHNELAKLLNDYSKPIKDELKEANKILNNPELLGEYIGGM